MKTNHSVRAVSMAIITLVTVVTFGMPVKALTISNNNLITTMNAQSPIENKKLESSEIAPLEKEQLEIKPAVDFIADEPSSLKIEIDVEELRQIKIARKRALELQRKKEEEERQKALELQRQQEEEARRKAEEEAARIEAERQAELASKSEANTGVSYDELVRKLNASLNSTLAGTGETFAKYAIELGIDPYLAVAIVLHETGCKWTCSSLLRECNNVGGMKGSPGCNGGSYKSFSSLDEGIKAFMNNLYNNYYAKGLTTPETIGPKYAASSTWASQIRNYMNELKAN